MEEEAPGCCTSVDEIGEALELHTLLMKLVYHVDEMLDATAKPVLLPDHEHLAVALRFLRFDWARPLSPTADGLVFEDLLATGLCQNFGL